MGKGVIDCCNSVCAQFALGYIKLSSKFHVHRLDI